MVDTVTDSTSCRSAVSEIENVHQNDNQCINTRLTLIDEQIFMNLSLYNFMIISAIYTNNSHHSEKTKQWKQDVGMLT